MTKQRIKANLSEESMELEYFSTPGRLGLIQQITYILQFGEGLPVVQGEPGSGKTFIASELASSMGADEVVVSVNAAKDGGLESMLRQIGQALGLVADAAKGCGELLVDLRRYASESVVSQQLAVVIIDDAHFLDESSLGALLSLLQGDSEAGMGLRMVFFAQRGLVEQIDEMQVVDVAVFDFEVPSMSASELTSFVEDFYPDLASLSQEKIKQAWNESNGNPGLAIDNLRQYVQKGSKGAVSKLKHDLPQLPSLKGIKWPSLKDFDLPVKHVLFLIIIVVIFIWAILVRYTGQGTTLGRPKVSVPLAEKTDTIVEGEEIVTDFDVSAPETESLDQENLNQIAEAVTPLPKLIKATPAPLPRPVEQVTTLPAPAKRNTSVNQGGTAGSVAHSADEQYLLSQPPGYFSLQVLSSARSLSLSSYLLRQENRKQLYLYRSLRKGQRRYVVVSGIYKTRQEAIKAIDQLPQEQRKAGPWPRQLKAIQHDIEKF